MIFHRPEAPLPPARLIPEPSTGKAEGNATPTGILLGQTIHWDPHGLPNPHVVVIGASGSGKTQTLKAMAYELEGTGAVIIIDFHGDQSLPQEVVYPLHMASPHGINPLTINPDPEGGGPHLQAIQVAMLIRKALTLGPIQEGLLLDTLKNLYAERGILQTDPSTWALTPPTFAHLEQAIQRHVEEGSSDHTKLQIKLAATFSYGIFSKPQPPFSAPLVRVDVSKLPPSLGSIAAESLAHQLMNQHRLQGESPPKTFLFIDEAKEMPKTSGSALDRIIMDGRKYGLALILASQSERHLSKDVIANSATKIVLPVDQTEVKTVARKFRFAEHLIAQLKPLSALVRLGSQAAQVDIYPYYRRVTDTPAPSIPSPPAPSTLRGNSPQTADSPLAANTDRLQNPGRASPGLELQPETEIYQGLDRPSL